MVGQRRNRVLLVDDDPVFRKLISGYLVAAGYVVRAAVDGLDAVGKLRAGLPDLIICDLIMPRMSGFELLKVVRRRFPQIPVMVISAKTAEAMPEGVAADAYYFKGGFGFEHLLETISDLAKKLPLRTASPHDDNRPARARRNEDGHYIIDCEDCLREFSALRVHRMGGDEKSATCVHCGKVIHFIVADGDTESPAQR